MTITSFEINVRYINYSHSNSKAMQIDSNTTVLKLKDLATIAFKTPIEYILFRGELLDDRQVVAKESMGETFEVFPILPRGGSKHNKMGD